MNTLIWPVYLYQEIIFAEHKCDKNTEEQILHLCFFKASYLPTDAQKKCFKRILIYTLKQLLPVSVQSPSSGSLLFELNKVILVVIKIIS
jgi:hypothetical protein